ncbi:MAG TPA: hypothetical protein VGK69_06255 [Gaiellaceae bacterium]
MHLRRRLLAEWCQTARRDPARNVVLAYRRAKVDDPNQSAHALAVE